MIVPDVGAILTLVAKPDPEVKETSYPVGAVTIKFAVRSVPETVKVCCEDTVPEQAINAVRVPVLVIVGGNTQFSVGNVNDIVFEVLQVGSV